MIVRLPGAYETRLGSGGRGLSFGQAQRIAIARALYGAPALLVFDEANAHLDAEGENCLIEALVALKRRHATVLIAAHRTSVLLHADKLLLLADGRIELFGPRDEVMHRLQAARHEDVGRPSQTAQAT